MSGFCGFLGKINENELKRMTETLQKDCTQTPVYFSDGYIHLGFVPYTESENAKIGHSDDFTVWTMIDGGVDKITPERIISSYISTGIAFAKELEGTFSIVLWDGVRKRLYLLRDRYGAKPLFYARTDEGLAFGSEIKTVLAHNSVNKDINLTAIYQYLSYQSIYAPETAFENIHHISPGCYGMCDGKSVEECAYIKMPFGECVSDELVDAAKKIDSFLETSVHKCAENDAAGIFLSGGLDSSYVAAIGAGEKIKYAFCLKPATAKYSLHEKETDVFFAEKLSKEYGMEFCLREMTSEDLIESADEILKAFSQPFSGTMSTYFLAKEASDICKTIFTGDGADELFGSYRHHSVVPEMERYLVCNDRKAEPFLESLYQYCGTNETLWYYRLLQMTDLEKDIFLNHDRFGVFIENKHTLTELVLGDKELKSKDKLNRCLERDFYYLLPGHTMLYQDTLARNFGIDLKMPFMNNVLTEYVINLPGEYKINEGNTKAILKSAGSLRLPKEIVYRKKEPFSLPIAEWMKVELKEYVTDILSKASVQRHGLLNTDCVQYALEEFYKYPDEKEYYGPMLWTMTMLERWAFLYM